MTRYQPETLNTIRDQLDCHRAVVFLHGFSGHRDDTWDRLLGLLGTVVQDWDIYTLDYATTFRPDFLGVWSADPDLPILATSFSTQVGIDPLRRYRSLAVVAHSMGGLIVQRALVDDPELADRTEKVVLFGTPSAGLRKASWLTFWKRQFRNMAEGSEFITTLRRDWAQRFEPEPGFDLKVVAGDQDRFVPPVSSLGPFQRRFHCVVAGDHQSMVRVVNTQSQSVRLLQSVLSGAPVADETTTLLALAAEIPDSAASEHIRSRAGQMSEPEVVRAALALERIGKREEALALMYCYQALGTDVQGTLAGRIKRMWLENEDLDLARHALALYSGALHEALKTADIDQIYYHAINVAFLELIAFDRGEVAREMAELALENATIAEENVWSTATRAEANLYLGQLGKAVALYQRMLELEAESWQYTSTALQAGQIASKLNDGQLAEKLEEIFTLSV